MSGAEMDRTGPKPEEHNFEELNASVQLPWQSNLPQGASTETFSTRVVLTVTTGRLLTEPQEERGNGFDNLYKILSYMTGDEAYTHALGRFAEECRPWLNRWYPGLQGVERELVVLDARLEAANDKQAAVEQWLTETLIKLGIPSELEVAQIPRDDHTVRDPSDELKDVAGLDKKILRIDLRPQEPEDPADWWKK